MHHELHNKLVEKLLEIPGIEDPGTRTSLLTGIPGYANCFPRNTNARTDLSLLVGSLAKLCLKTGESPLQILIANAQSHIGKEFTLYDELEDLLQQYEQVIHNSKKRVDRSDKPSPAYQLLDFHRFDLDTIVQGFVDAVLESQGVIGFAIPCDYPDFHKTFCDRIAYTFKKDYEFMGGIDISLPLKLRYTTVEDVIKVIKEYNSIKKYVLFPIKLGETTGKTPEYLWKRVYDEFKDNTKRTVIIIMIGRSKSDFPKNVIKLTIGFTDKDVRRWVLSVGTYLNWPSARVMAEWEGMMLEECKQDDILDMEYIYEYIKKISTILNIDKTICFDDFLHQVQQRRIYYE